MKLNFSAQVLSGKLPHRGFSLCCKLPSLQLQVHWLFSLVSGELERFFFHKINFFPAQLVSAQKLSALLLHY